MQTRTATYTNTYAQHVASKIATDLKRLQRIYQQSTPSDSYIADFQQEAAMLLDKGYLGTVTYGFIQNDKWVIALRYKALNSGLSGGDDDPGGLGYEDDLSDTYFHSFLTYSSSWRELPEAMRHAFKESLPIKRVAGEDHTIENGFWADSRQYSAGHLGVKRSLIERN